MEADAAPDRRPGGTVEPVQRATVAKSFFQVSDEPQPKTYELRDPFAEVTYRSADRASIQAKADELGATRIHERDAEGRRIAFNKIDGRWQPDAHQREPASAPTPTGDAKDRDRTASEKVATLTTPARPLPEPPPSERMRRVEADAARAARIEALESALHERYVIKRPPLTVRTAGLGQTEYRFRGDTNRIAFTESMLKLSTDNNNPSVARSMVDVAETRKWGAIRISGNDEFKRLVWLEASVRGLKTVGYQPQRTDVELLSKEIEARRRNRIEPAPRDRNAPPETSTSRPSSSGAPSKQSARGGGGRKAVLAALEAVLVDRKVPLKRREAVMTAAAEQLAQRTAAGQVHKIKILDKDAPPQRTATLAQPKVNRQRERTGPAR